MAFALDRFDVDDGRLVVAGRWYGVTGRRFVRPVLHAPGQRRLIAVLDHKPWVAEEGREWLAVFPHDGGVGPARLQVATDIAVELPASGPDAGDGVPRPARLSAPRKAEEPRRPTSVEDERDAAAAQIEAFRLEKVEARTEADRLRGQLDDARKESERLQTELDHARTDIDNLRTELSHVRAEANTLRQEHDEAKAKADQLEAEVSGLRTDTHRAVSERSAAQLELDRMRRTGGGSGPYIAPRPVPFQPRSSGPSWQLRVLAAAIVVIAVGVLLLLVGGF
jgi:regulator of replication initiation timing